MGGPLEVSSNHNLQTLRDVLAELIAPLVQEKLDE